MTTPNSTVDPTDLFEYEGRIGRLRFFITYLTIIVIVITVKYTIDDYYLLRLMGAIPLTYVAVVATVKRLHDFDASGWHTIWKFIPFANVIFLAVLLFRDGTDGPNRFGVSTSRDMPAEIEAIKKSEAEEPSPPVDPQPRPIQEQQVKIESTSSTVEDQLRKLKYLFEQGLMDEETYRHGQKLAVEKFSNR